MTVPMSALPQRCATCQHEHTGPMRSLTDFPRCPDCGCADFRLHPDDLAAAEADDALEQAYYPNGRLLGAGAARGIAAAAAAYEQDLAWDQPMRVGCILAHSPRDEDGGRVRLGGSDGAYAVGLLAAPLDLRYADLLRRADGNPNTILQVLADTAADRPDLFDAIRQYSLISPAEPAAAWWMSWEAWVRDTPGDTFTESAADRPELASDELRTLFCIDIDERVTEINRLRRTGTRHVSTDPWPLFVARLTGESPPPDGGLSAIAGRVPPALDGLVRLVRHGRVEAAARDVIVSALAGND